MIEGENPKGRAPAEKHKKPRRYAAEITAGFLCGFIVWCIVWFDSVARAAAAAAVAYACAWILPRLTFALFRALLWYETRRKRRR